MFSHYSVAEPFTFPRALSSRNLRILRWYWLLVEGESGGRLRRMETSGRQEALLQGGLRPSWQGRMIMKRSQWSNEYERA